MTSSENAEYINECNIYVKAESSAILLQKYFLFNYGVKLLRCRLEQTFEHTTTASYFRNPEPFSILHRTCQPPDLEDIPDNRPSSRNHSSPMNAYM